MTRRTALFSAAAAPALLAASGPARAQEGGQALPIAKARTFRVGAFDVTTLLAGSFPREDPHSIFGGNVSDEEFAAVSEENFLDPAQAQFFFTPTLVDTGAERILFDTGLNAAAMESALGDAGYAPDDVTHVVLTHMHGDHIGGMTTEAGELTYPNAAYATAQAEFDHWAAQENEGFEAKVRPFAERFAFLGDGDTVAGGVTAMAAFGHTPGHMTYRLESEGAELVLIADLANHYVYSLAYPDWEVVFDTDKEAAAASRRRILSMLAADRVPMIGYHMPFPAAGFVETRGEGFRYVPVSYQMMG
jgi:glyoxylase-like metal-dependent hydrolase (beta-lactamase superfamily II)